MSHADHDVSPPAAVERATSNKRGTRRHHRHGDRLGMMQSVPAPTYWQAGVLPVVHNQTTYYHAPPPGYAPPEPFQQVPVGAPNRSSSHFVNARSRLYQQQAHGGMPQQAQQQSPRQQQQPPSLMTQSMHETQQPSPGYSRRFAPRAGGGGGAPRSTSRSSYGGGGGSSRPPRTYGRTMRKPRHHGSLGLLSTMARAAQRPADADCAMSMVDGALGDKLNETRTSKQRLQTYYTLVWEDGDDNKIEPPAVYSDDNMTNSGSDEYDFDEEIYAGSSDISSDGGRSVARDDELDAKLLFIGNKRFFIDVKENFHGRFIKLAEASASMHPQHRGGAAPSQYHRKSRIILSMPASAMLVTHMDEMLEYLRAHPEKSTPDGPPVVRNGERAPQPEPIKAIKMVDTATAEKKTYTIELRENHRGKFVRISMTESVTQMRSRAFHSTIQVSDDGLVEIRNALAPLVDKWNKDLPEDKGYKGAMPETKSFRVGPRSFYFDYGQNSRGVFLRVSEVKPAWRTSVSVPRSEWETMRDIFTEACKVVDREEGAK